MGPAPEVERAEFGEGHVAIAEQIRDGGFGGAEIGATGKVRVEHREGRLGPSAIVVGDRRLDADGKKFIAAELDAVAVEDRWKQRVDVPVQPLAHALARRGMGSLEAAERPGTVLD